LSLGRRKNQENGALKNHTNSDKEKILKASDFEAVNVTQRVRP